MANNEKKLNLADFFYVVKKCWLVECIILAVCIAVGVAVAFVTPRYYVASVDVFVDAETGTVTTDASLAKYYVPSICETIKGDYVINRVSQKTGKKCSSTAVTVTNEDDSLVINIKYKDATEQDAKVKLTAIVNALKEFYEDGEGPLVNKKLKLTPQYLTAEDGSPTPKVTVGSKKRTIVLLSGILGVAAVFIYALCVYFIADKISSSDRLEDVSGLKTLGVVSKKKIDKKEANYADKLIDLDLTKVADALIYDHICANRQIYQIESSVASEGKTSVTVNLAKSLTEAHRKTIIIDCDFSKPSVHRKLSLHRHVGITEYFKGVKTFDEIVKHTPYADVITCGDRIENHSIFFTSDKFKQLLDEAKGKYEFVLLDCAPIRVVSDYISISAVADASILVVANNKASARDVEYSVRELESSGSTVIGTVLNFADGVADRYYYQNKYAYVSEFTTEDKSE